MTHTPDQLKIAEKALNAQRTELKLMNLFDLAELTNINLALFHIKIAERQQAWRENGDDGPDQPVDNFTNPSFSDLSRGDVK